MTRTVDNSQPGREQEQSLEPSPTGRTHAAASQAEPTTPEPTTPAQSSEDDAFNVGVEDVIWLNLRVHIQGTFLLITLLLAFWYALNWSTAVIDDAVSGEDGAIVAVARTGDASDYEPLDNSEVFALQAALADAGYDPGPLDGMLGSRTRRAIDQARAQLGLEGLPDRSFLQALIGGTDTRTGPDNTTQNQNTRTDPDNTTQ